MIDTTERASVSAREAHLKILISRQKSAMLSSDMSFNSICLTATLRECQVPLHTCGSSTDRYTMDLVRRLESNFTPQRATYHAISTTANLSLKENIATSKLWNRRIRQKIYSAKSTHQLAGWHLIKQLTKHTRAQRARAREREKYL